MLRPFAFRNRVNIPALPCCQVTLRQQRRPPRYPREIKNLADHIRARRIQLQLLQRDVASRIGVHKDTVTNWELGHSSPDIYHLPAIFNFLGYDPRPQSQTLGRALRRLREGQGLSQAGLAAILAVDPSTLARWERDERIPTGPYRERVDRALSTQRGTKAG